MAKAGNGWVRWCWLLLIGLLNAPTHAQTDNNSEGDEVQNPSLEMLEFLGGWEDSDGDAEDPLYWKEFFEEDVVIPQPTETEDDER